VVVHGAALAKAFRRRERVDYDVYYSASEEETTSAVEEAERFVERIDLAIRQIRERS